ncbi:sensor histidine kinase [Streptomyces sp. NPDC057638]|uniref:sensor histidine kinase n=1 Tax=Streptomyces sp. NPDC057638 TaxID=3346190 RepID=UPI0036B7F4C2
MSVARGHRSGAGLAWPARESLTRIGVPRVRLVLDVVVQGGLAVWAVSSAYASGVFPGARAALPLLGLLLCAAVALRYRRTTLENRLMESVGLLLVVGVLGWGAHRIGAELAAAMLWISVAVVAMGRLPLLFGLVVGAAATGCLVLARDGHTVITVLATVGGVLLGGYSLRLDAQARGAGFRLLAQERAVREAEALSAALGERARIAREIHDVLAHSLSAQLVHLEAARIWIEREPEGPFRDRILERVVAARGMAREGLFETRQALSALRGELTPIEEYLLALAHEEGVEAEVSGEPRRLDAEVSQAVRRVAQEALTNARKHAPGSTVWFSLGFETAAVTLEIRDSGPTAPTGELRVSGSGYGLLGMRERAELLDGTLDAGPEGEGFVVKLRVPV